MVMAVASYIHVGIVLPIIIPRLDCIIYDLAAKVRDVRYKA